MARRPASPPSETPPASRSGTRALPAGAIATLTALAALAAAGLAVVTLHPALIFAEAVEGPAVAFHGTEPFDDCAAETRADLAFLALRADTGATWTHHVYFAAAAPRFQALQRTLGRERGAYTFNRSAPPFISQSITFRTPDFCADALSRPGAPDIPLKFALLHEIGHSILRRAVGKAAVDLPAWKREGFADRIAADALDPGRGRCTVLAAVRRVTDVDAAIATLDAYARPEGDAIELGDGKVWPADYALSRALVSQLMDEDGLDVAALAADPRDAAEVYAELAQACG